MSSSNSYSLNLAKKYPFLKKIYFFYNIYIRNLKFYFNSSQFGEDKIIYELFDKSYKGRYVDLGCFHPTRQNNTFKMYKTGWRGINIDLNTMTIDLFKFTRPGDINLRAAISNKKGSTNLFYIGDLASQNTIEKNHTNFLKNHFGLKTNDIKIKKIKTQKINDIFEKYKYYNIDFMNIDIEGHELKVLNSLNFKKFDISVICVEIFKHNKFSGENKKKILKLFKKNGYFLKHKGSINYIFKKIKPRIDSTYK